MKKITGVFAITIALLMINNFANAQAFQKGNINIDLGIGFGAYGTKSTFTTTSNGVSISDSETDGAASTLVPVQIEYGVTDRIGVGFLFQYNNYFINDSDKVSLDKVSCVDFGLNFNFHLLNSDRNDLFVTAGLGMSSISVDYTSLASLFVESYGGTGVYYGLGITDRFFILDNVGLLFNISYRGYSYSALEAEFTPDAKTIIANSSSTFTQELDWSFSGVNIGTGIALKF